MTSGLYSKSSARSHLGIEDDIFVFGTIGRLVNKKGHIYLLEAFKQLHECYPSAKLVIIGEGKLKKTLLSYIHRNKLESSVIMTGEIFDAYHFIKAFDVFVLSSLSEAFGLAILESMIAKVPVIATDVGGVKYVVGEKGKLIPAANTDALFKAMKEHINLNAEQRQLLGDELYSRAVNKFSIEDYHKKYRNLVENF
jgi:glycosyltransferase involved in cell wall biosynthesis